MPYRVRISPSGKYENFEVAGLEGVASPNLLNTGVEATTPNQTLRSALIAGVPTLWVLDRNSAETPDGVTVVAASLGGGNWHRQELGADTSRWGAQTGWEIDAVAGDDLASGAPGDPLATFAEFRRRVSAARITVAMVVSISNTLGDPLDGAFHFSAGGSLHIQGTAPTTQATDTIATWTAASTGANEYHLITATGIADWTPYEGMRVRLTDGADSGAVFWIAKANPNALGLNVARVSKPIKGYDAAGTLVVPTPGTGIVIETLTEVPSQCSLRSLTSDTWFSESILVTDIHIVGGFAELNSDSIQLGGCRLFYPFIQTDIELQLLGCVLAGNGCAIRGGEVQLKACLVLGTGTIYCPSVITESLWQGCMLKLLGYCRDMHGFVGVFDSPNDGVNLLGPNASCHVEDDLIGKGNTDYGVRVTNGQGVLSYATKPIITGAINDTLIGPTPRAWATVPFICTVCGAAIVTP